jgi:DNA invertase Pin-like site-specific DNA recombinase
VRYAAYVRVSRDEQVLGYSLDAQERLVHHWVQSQSGDLAGEVVVVYRDEGHSARTDDRPAFQQMIADARTGRFDAIVVHKFDRLARDRQDSVTYKALLRKKLGLKVLSASEPSEDSDGSLGVLIEGILEVVAHWYSLNLAAETRKGKREKAEEGRWHGAAPTGYCNGKCRDCRDPNGPGYCAHAGHPDRGDGEVLLPHPIESEAIRLAFEWYSSGDCSDRDIADKLNQFRFETSEGREVRFRTKFYGRQGSRSGPGPFEKDTVQDILTRSFYAGLVEYYGVDPRTGKRRTRPLIVRQGQHEPLVSLQLFQRCQDVRRNRGRAASSKTATPL